ncbi:MAG: hypothetical protein QXL10_00265 [Candidatus Bathyarchaeia archaeon]
MTEPEKFKLADILYGLVIPLVVGILIVLFPAVLRPALDAAFPPANMMTGDPGSPYAFITVILTHGFASMIILAVPLILGLIWNKWAGGAAGFLMGSLYYVAWAGYNTQYSVKIAIDAYYAMGKDPNVFIQSLPPNLWADPSFIGNWIVGGILIGYIAGALNNKSMRFKRMLGAGLTASITVALMQFVLNMTVASGAWMAQADPGFALFTVMLPGILLGIIAPIIAKVMTWYGIMPGGHY